SRCRPTRIPLHAISPHTVRGAREQEDREEPVARPSVRRGCPRPQCLRPADGAPQDPLATGGKGKMAETQHLSMKRFAVIAAVAALLASALGSAVGATLAKDAPNPFTEADAYINYAA